MLVTIFIFEDELYMGELYMGGVEPLQWSDTLCAPSLCASLVTWFSLHFVVEWSDWIMFRWVGGTMGGDTLCAAALHAEMWLRFVATCCGGSPGSL